MRIGAFGERKEGRKQNASAKTPKTISIGTRKNEEVPTELPHRRSWKRCKPAEKEAMELLLRKLRTLKVSNYGSNMAIALLVVVVFV